MKESNTLKELETVVGECLNRGVIRPIPKENFEDGNPKWKDVFQAGNDGYASALRDVISAIGGEFSRLVETSLRKEALDRLTVTVQVQGPEGTFAPQEIAAAEIATDIHSGLSEVLLNKKYGLAPGELRNIFDSLLMWNLVFPDELPKALDREAAMIELRREPRGYLNFALSVHDLKHPKAKGQVFNITERGVAVTGLAATVNEVRSLQLSTEEFFGMNAIEFEARCRWGRTQGASGDFLAGFEIVSISESAYRNLQEFINSLTAEE
jgi:hypothetical protein